MTPATRRWVTAGLFAGMFWACSSDGTVVPPPPPPPPQVVEIDIFGPDGGVPVGGTFKMIVVALDSTNHAVTPPALTWTSSSPSVATVSSDGVVSAIAVGKTTIQAQGGGLTSVALITVTLPPAAAIKVLGPSGALTAGNTFGMSIAAFDSAGKPAAVPTITWSSSNPDVATITSSGLLQAVAAGNATIQAQAGALIATFDVIVRQSLGPSTLVINGNSTMPVGGAEQLYLTAFDAQSTQVSPPPAVWTSSNPQVATVSTSMATQSVTITAVALGSTTIRVQAGALTAQLVVTVTTPAAADIRVSLLPDGEFGDSLLAAPGGTLQLYSFEYFAAFPNQFIQSPVTWTSSRPDLATVSSSGLVTAIAAGSAGITATVTVGTGPGAAQVAATRKIKIAATPGTASVRLVNAGDASAGLTLQSNAGAPVHLAFGDVHPAIVPAGTFQLAAQEYLPLTSPFCAPNGCFDDNFISVQQYTGILPAGSHATFVATPNQGYRFSIAPLWDRATPVPADSAAVRVVLVADGGSNVYFVDPGAPIGVIYLQGCYLDWPYGVTDYSTRRTGSFDIVLQPGKGTIGPESARFTVTPAPGHATTYILAGTTATPKILTLVDN